MKTILSMMLACLVSGCESEAEKNRKAMDARFEQMRASLDRSEEKLREHGKVLDLKERALKLEAAGSEMQKLNLELEQIRLAMTGAAKQKREALMARTQEIKREVDRIQLSVWKETHSKVAD